MRPSRAGLWRLGLAIGGCTLLLVVGAGLAPGAFARAVPLLVTLLGVAALELFVIRLSPAAYLTMTPVVALTSLALAGWPNALVGTALGIAVTLGVWPARHVVAQEIEVLFSLATAAAASSLVSLPSIPRSESVVIIGCLAYACGWTLVTAERLHLFEGIAPSRALQFLVTTATGHIVAFGALAVATVAAATAAGGSILAAALAASVALQIYLPRIGRGLEEEQVLAAVAVLATAVDVKDPYTGEHSEAVADLCRRVARVLALDEQTVERVHLAGLLHDVGKIGVPTEILCKPDRLTAAERAIINRHVEDGAAIVTSISGLSRVVPIVASSHEHLDGSGYPRGLRGNAIALGARINLVVDAYNALTTDRPYRRGRAPAAALTELDAHAGSQFDPQVIAALRVALRVPGPSARQLPPWLALLRQPAFGLLWGGELVSFLGDEIFYIAVSLWVYQLTGSIVILATTLVATTAGQALLGFVAGAMADRTDRRAVMITTDIVRGAIVVALPFILPVSFPAGLVLLFILSVGSVFFRAGLYAVIPSIVTRSEMQTATALFATTERIAEVIGGVVGGALVVLLGYHIVFNLDALSFGVSAVCVALMPVAWRQGLAPSGTIRFSGAITESLRYMWREPSQRFLMLLLIPGYLTLSMTTLHAPMVLTAAHLTPIAFGVTNSALGAGKLAGALWLAGWSSRLRIGPTFVVWAFVFTAGATALFGATTLYPVLIFAAFLWGLGNVTTNIGNQTLISLETPSYLLGRIVGNRQGLLNGVKVIGLLGFGRVGQLAGPQAGLWALGATSALGVIWVWLAARRYLPSLPVAEQPRVPGITPVRLSVIGRPERPTEPPPTRAETDADETDACQHRLHR